MRVVLLASLSLSFLTGCKSSDRPSENLPKADSSASNQSGIIKVGFDEKSFPELVLPFKADSVFVEKADTNSRIDYIQIRSVGNQCVAMEGVKELSSVINGICEIDSMKENDAYTDYLKKLDIGMRKNSIAFKLGHVKLNEQLKLFIWGIEESSYEACPFFSGKFIIGTLVNAEKDSYHFLLAKNFGAGDPPSMMNETSWSEIDANGNIHTVVITENDDMDAPGKDVVQTEFEFRTENNGIKQIKFEKKVISKEEQPQNAGEAH